MPKRRSGWGGPTHLDHAKTLLVVSTGDFEDVACELLAKALALNSLRDKSGMQLVSQPQHHPTSLFVMARIVTWLMRLS
jgi:hypothetical protein